MKKLASYLSNEKSNEKKFNFSIAKEMTYSDKGEMEEFDWCEGSLDEVIKKTEKYLGKTKSNELKKKVEGLKPFRLEDGSFKDVDGEVLFYIIKRIA